MLRSNDDTFARPLSPIGEGAELSFNGPKFAVYAKIYTWNSFIFDFIINLVVVNEFMCGLKLAELAHAYKFLFGGLWRLIETLIAFSDMPPDGKSGCPAIYKITKLYASKKTPDPRGLWRGATEVNNLRVTTSLVLPLWVRLALVTKPGSSRRSEPGHDAISPEPNRRLSKTVLVWICNENNFKKTCSNFHREYYLT